MPALAGLNELARLAEQDHAAAAVSRALTIVRDQLHASAAFLVYGTDDDFLHFEESEPLELSKTAIWLINRELTSRDGPVSFRSRYGRVADFAGIDDEQGQHDYLAMILPGAPSTAYMLIVHGPWLGSHSERGRDYIRATAPALSAILQRRLKIARAENDQKELGTLFTVGRVISEVEELPTMLMQIASSVASLAGVNHVVIDILGSDGEVRLRCMNNELSATSSWVERWTRAAQRPDPVRNIVVATRQPMVFEDAQNDERIPERGRAFFTSTLIRSTAVFPLVMKDHVVGVLSLGSNRPTLFEGRQRELIEGVAAQIATAVRGVQLYDDRVEAEAALRESEALLTATLESTADGILAVDDGGRVIHANRRFAEMWRIPDNVLAENDDEKLIRSVLSQLKDPDAWLSRVQALYASSEESFDTLIFQDGRVFERYSRALLQGDRIAGRVWSFRDVTERQRTEELLIAQARHDSLTGLLNHAAISEALRESVAVNSFVGVIVVDVDGMKAVNDTYGHVAGDRVLVAVAAALTQDGVQVGRYGGDEFVVLLPGADRPGAEQYCQLALQSLAQADVRDPASGSHIPLAVSMGATIWPTEVRLIDDAIRVADGAMYLEKRERSTVIAGINAVRPVLTDDRAARMIGEIVPILTSSARLDEKLRRVAGRISEGAGYSGVRFFFERGFSGEGRSAVVQRVDGVTQPREQGIAPQVTELVKRTRRPVFIEDLAQDERVPDDIRTNARVAGLGPALCVPMVSQNTVIGSISVATPHGAPLDARDARFLTAVGEQVMAITRLESLVDDLEASAARLEDARADTVIMLAAAAEAHDAATGRHLVRVRTITELLARELAYSPEDAENLALAAVLHDIGKIRVPDSILVSPARLNGEEWALMKQHTIWGADFLRQRPGFELAAIVAQNHHERWDGSGYPAGLARDAIPAAAAIVTVADSLDAMTNDRPYRAGRPLRWAIDEIIRCSGTQFSPRVVDALLRLHEKRTLDFLSLDHDLLEAA